MKDITKIVARLRLEYHSTMLDVYNVANQLGIVKDEKAEEVMKHHAMECADAIERLTGKQIFTEDK